MITNNHFRTLNRKIRAEEMLKISNLPPSMAKRAESCLSYLDSSVKPRRRKKRRVKKQSKSPPERICSSTSKRQKTPSNSSVISSSCESTPLPSSYPVNRPNLAATLRVQSARQKVRELAKPKSLVPENKLTVCEGHKNAWGVRKAPAWKSMTYE